MKTNKYRTQFWMVLSTINFLSLIYAISLVRRAESTDQSLFAAFALIGIVFLLVVVDAVSIVVSDALDIGKH